MTQPESELGKENERLKAEIASLKAELQKARQWVSVNERSPNRVGFYLTFDTYSESLPIKLNQWSSAHWFQNHSTVTHWQELPEPPKE